MERMHDARLVGLPPFDALSSGFYQCRVL